MVLYIVTVPGMSLVLLQRLGECLFALRQTPAEPSPFPALVRGGTHWYDCEVPPVDNRRSLLSRPGSMAV
ncbi:hypothetical protein GCM10010238_14050 [Streptomyces griseoviridis]|uniref:Uncharacterized protein n=1 Tax=Streptomyces griseoviridis TaxID=45398 RepID=A0A918LBD8_STRGD|nr:hypothetical protein GCM10010238_14050 [Streptomyces niveoruber]